MNEEQEQVDGHMNEEQEQVEAYMNEEQEQVEGCMKRGAGTGCLGSKVVYE